MSKAGTPVGNSRTLAVRERYANCSDNRRARRDFRPKSIRSSPRPFFSNPCRRIRKSCLPQYCRMPHLVAADQFRTRDPCRLSLRAVAVHSIPEFENSSIKCQ